MNYFLFLQPFAFQKLDEYHIFKVWDVIDIDIKRNNKSLMVPTANETKFSERTKHSMLPLSFTRDQI